MMTILNRYIAKTVVFSTLLVFLIISALAFFINFLGELQDIGEGDYGVFQAAVHSFFELPHTLYQFYPMMILLGGLIGLGMLASNSELIVMRTSGRSIQDISKAVFSAAIFLIVFGLILGEIIAPHGHFLANKHKSAAENGGQAVATKTGVWIHEKNNFLHIERVIGQKHLEGVTRYAFDENHKLQSAYYVNQMRYDAGQWHLYKMVQTTFAEDQTSHASFEKSTWDLTLNPKLLSVGISEPDEMPLTELYTYTHHLKENGLQSAEFAFNFWKRVFQPLTMIVMLMLAIPFVFAAPRSVSMGLRMLTGVVVGFIFYIGVALVGQVSIVFQFSPVIAALLPIVLAAGLGYLFYFLLMR